jgi:DNA-binding response OmpR family regulator
MLPGLDGFSVARRLRGARNQTPILMLTARDASEDVVAGLNLGADDYLVKPFSFDVLLARLRAVSRRGPISQPVVLQVADLALNAASRDVTRNGRRISLTRTEYSLLELLMKRAGRVVTRENLIEAIWGFDSDVRGNTLDAFIRLLRDKIDTEGDAKLIHTVRGVGYAIKPEAA